MLLFVRHGESEANRKNVFAGQRDNSHLTEKGEAQAKAVGQKLLDDNIHIDHMLVSTLDRTRATARIIAETIGFDPEHIVYEKRLAEYDMGLLSGTPIHPISSAEIASHPEAEDPDMFQRRLLQVVEEARALNGNTLLVSHTGAGRMLQATQDHKPVADFYDEPGFENGEIAELHL